MFLEEWNDDPSNRDKTILIFNELKDTKDKLLENIQLMAERDLKIETCLIKSKELEKTSITYRDHSRKLKNSYKRRRYCMCFIASIILLISAAVIALILYIIVKK